LLDIGWGAKSRAICRIAAELNIGQDAVAFDDNDAAERAEVAAELPMVRCHSAAQVGELASRPELQPRYVDPLSLAWETTSRATGDILDAQSLVECIQFAVSQPRDCFINEFRFEPAGTKE
jgi:predicted enzyme involved in methoxymalonyl-ACP biosynthesis